VIIQLGVPSGTIAGFDIDTTLFNGNEAPACSVYALDRLTPPPDSPDDPEVSSQGGHPLNEPHLSKEPTPRIKPQWTQLLPVVPLGPSARHLFKIPETTKGYRYLKLNMIPDGSLSLSFSQREKATTKRKILMMTTS
jgi:allantoicase